MPDPFDLFDAIYCINLDSRPDRWHAAQQELQRVGIAGRVERFAAIVPENGPSGEGCARSHQEIVRAAHAAGRRNVLVLEDDVVFAWDTATTLRLAQQQLTGRHWDVLYLGATAFQLLENVSANLVRIRNCYATHAICYNASIYPVVLEQLRPGEHLIDVWLSIQVQPHFRCLGVYPLVASQRAGYSDISGQFANYTLITSNYRTEPTSAITPFPERRSW